MISFLLTIASIQKPQKNNFNNLIITKFTLFAKYCPVIKLATLKGKND